MGLSKNNVAYNGGNRDHMDKVHTFNQNTGYIEHGNKESKPRAKCRLQNNARIRILKNVLRRLK